MEMKIQVDSLQKKD